MFCNGKNIGLCLLIQLATIPTSANSVCSPASTKPPKLAPEIVSDTGDQVFRGVLSANRSEFYFFRSLGPNENYGIFKSNRNESGVWETPKRVVLGAQHSDLYPALSLDGQQLVFAS